MGTYREGDSVLYINPGTNYWGIPFRIGAWSEVTVVTLQRSRSPVGEAVNLLSQDVLRDDS